MQNEPVDRASRRIIRVAVRTGGTPGPLDTIQSSHFWSKCGGCIASSSAAGIRRHNGFELLQQHRNMANRNGPHNRIVNPIVLVRESMT